MVNRLLRTDILVELPDDTDERYKKQSSGLYVATLREQRYAPTHGIVIQKAEGATQIELGDTVFFANHRWGNAKQRAFGSDDAREKGHYVPFPDFAIIRNGKKYMIMPEREVIFIKRGESIVAVNDIVLAEPIKKFDATDVSVSEIQIAPKSKKIIVRDAINIKNATITDSGFALVDNAESYQTNKFKVFAAPEGSTLVKGDIIYTLRHCDIEAENPLNNPILPEYVFQIEVGDIVAKEDKDYSSIGIKPLAL